MPLPKRLEQIGLADSPTSRDDDELRLRSGGEDFERRKFALAVDQGCRSPEWSLSCSTTSCNHAWSVAQRSTAARLGDNPRKLTE